MKSDTPLDYAIFQLSPKRSRCELFVSSSGTTEKLASGLVKPFATQLKVAEEQVALAAQTIKLEADDEAQVWFTKGTLERFVRFVSTPEVLELVNTFDAEMSQLEAARKIYSQGVGGRYSNASGGDGIGTTTAADATKMELIKAIDVRLVALKQDLSTACARASAAGFNPVTVSGLQHFANRFGAHRLNEACTKFMAVGQRRPDMITWNPGFDDRAVRSSAGSDMSIEDPTIPEPDTLQQTQLPNSLSPVPPVNNNGSEEQRQEDSYVQKSQPRRRLSVQDRINLFENKQKESSGGKPVVSKSAELRRLSSDASGPAVLRRWNRGSDMSTDVSGEDKDITESPLCTPSSSVPGSHAKSNVFSENQTNLNNTATPSRVGVSSLKDQTESEDLVKDHKEQASYVCGVSLEKLKVYSADEERNGENKDQASCGTKLKGLFDLGDVDAKNQDISQNKIETDSVFVKRAEDVQQNDQMASQQHARQSQSHLQSHDKGSEGDRLGPQVQWEPNKDLETSEEQEAAKPEVSRVQRMKFKKPVPAGLQRIKKSQNRKEEVSPASGSNKPMFPIRNVSENDDSFGTPTEQVRARQSKGNQELNDELKIKANELEKLFAEHKLRVPGDQTGLARRGKPHMDQSVSSHNQSPALVESWGSSSNMNFNSPPVKMADNQDNSPAYDSRGKFYEKYTQKRNSKLREEWGSNRAEKEAKMKAMRDKLEQSRAELREKFLNGDSIWKEQRIDSIQSGEDETFSGDSACRSSQAKKFMHPRNMFSCPSPSRTAAVPRSSVKSPSPGGPGKQRVEPENPLAQSVPNFSGFRKENSKPSSGVSKMTTRSLVPLVKEEKMRRHQSLRKSLANTVELKDASPLSSDNVNTQNVPVLYDTFSKHVASKPFLRKGNGIGPGAGASIAKLKASLASERDEEEFDEVPFDAEDSGNIVKEEEEEEELESIVVEDSAGMDSGKPSQESDKSGSAESEDDDSIRSLSQVDPASAIELPGRIPSLFHLTAPLQDSPISWNSGMHHPFPYQHETSDIDASVDSPTGSPASLNSHSLAQTDSDAARMRKKWATAQKPVLVSNSSHNQSRKDMTKGFKRLLNFGRKKSGAESLVDWISATTSEGDDDTEDGRDPASRLSEDLGKSRMGLSQGHPSDDGFNKIQDMDSSIPAAPVHFKLREDLIFESSLKAPKSSFFSLSSFRSRGNDSKPR